MNNASAFLTSVLMRQQDSVFPDTSFVPPFSPAELLFILVSPPVDSVATHSMFSDLFHGARLTIPCQARQCGERSSTPSAGFMS